MIKVISIITIKENFVMFRKLWRNPWTKRDALQSNLNPSLAIRVKQLLRPLELLLSQMDANLLRYIFSIATSL